MSTTTQGTRVFVVYIKAKPNAVWDAITKPEWTKQYGYGGEADFDLRPGRHFVHHTSAEMKAMGAPEVAVDGEVVEVDPPRRLVQTWRMAMDETIAAEGYSRLTYELEERDGGVTKLTLIHDLEGAPLLENLVSGAMEDQGAGGGWNWVLSDLKSLLETGSRLAG
jgi:uncharacterized protein YndB with AHSA1/START domain